ncbi:prenyltransferase/squalene oxidase repeat-containing protein [Mangrovibacillus cuniculi]|uniref:Squalene--hopene cyclase n=1 Tax=Mangrovibacillus cuniculi TaxID=2593652 RepID=A0A7S8CDR9_9BACI|nr:prenyltransferase/squalene oxidase repeat-containing protein [Mangrovibacillus cuniculi]QPC48130.1 squalene--hopene cyclase [Mangrovibacillus cuniculi]
MSISRVNILIEQLTSSIEDFQVSDGSFRFPFEGPIMTDAYTMILLTSLNQKDHPLIRVLGQRLIKLQTADGTWKLFHDEKNGNLSSTVEAYFALLYSGVCAASDPMMKKAETYIRDMGGLDKVHSITKFMLASHGQYPWSRFFPIPIEILLLPSWSPIHFYDFSSYARVHLAPMLILKHKRYIHFNKHTPSIRHLVIDQRSPTIDTEQRKLLENITTHIHDLVQYPSEEALHRAKNYMLDRTEDDGTYYSYFSSTFFYIYALLATGHLSGSALVRRAVNGVLGHYNPRIQHVENSPSTIWDTALVTYVLQTPGYQATKQVITSAVPFLLKHQHTKKGDWALERKNVEPGGWGFSNSNTIHPDLDDTSAALRALHFQQVDTAAIDRGEKYLLAMQNEAGGSPAFEPNKTKKIYTAFPMDGAEAAAIDPSTPDLTGRVIEYFGTYKNFTLEHTSIRKAVDWLRSKQREDGSWFGRWGVCFIYGTWASVTGLASVGVKPDDDMLKKAVKFLLSTQNPDGGWGESCYSDQKDQYVPLYASTPSQTAWALDGLISVYPTIGNTPSNVALSIEKGMESLCKQLLERNWTYSYPTGAGLPGNFYMYYHSYNWIFPLKALKNYIIWGNETTFPEK